MPKANGLKWTTLVALLASGHSKAMMLFAACEQFAASIDVYGANVAKRKSTSLAISEYVSPDSDISVQVWRARLQLIETAKQVYPSFLEKLLKEVFPVYSQLRTTGKLTTRSQNKLWSRNASAAFSEYTSLEKAFRKWATHFNADVEWVIVGAMRTLRDWEMAPDWREALRWNPHHPYKERLVVGERFDFFYPGWEVQRLSWRFYMLLPR